MTISVALIALIRLIPYAFTAINAWAKGYKWLTITAVYFIALAVFLFFIDVDQNIRSVLASVGAFLLMLHALDLKPKKE